MNAERSPSGEVRGCMNVTHDIMAYIQVIVGNGLDVTDAGSKSVRWNVLDQLG